MQTPHKNAVYLPLFFFQSSEQPCKILTCTAALILHFLFILQYPPLLKIIHSMHVGDGCSRPRLQPSTTLSYTLDPLMVHTPGHAPILHPSHPGGLAWSSTQCQQHSSTGSSQLLVHPEGPWLVPKIGHTHFLPLTDTTCLQQSVSTAEGQRS